jgi:hypothetical protein
MRAHQSDIEGGAIYPQVYTLLPSESAIATGTPPLLSFSNLRHTRLAAYFYPACCYHEQHYRLKSKQCV